MFKDDKYLGKIELNLKNSLDDFSTFTNEMSDVYNLIVNRGGRMGTE